MSITLKIDQLLELIRQLGYEERKRIMDELSIEKGQADIDSRKSDFFTNVEKLKCHLPEGYRFDRDEIHER